MHVSQSAAIRFHPIVERAIVLEQAQGTVFFCYCHAARSPRGRRLSNNATVGRQLDFSLNSICLFWRDALLLNGDGGGSLQLIIYCSSTWIYTAARQYTVLYQVRNKV